MNLKRLFARCILVCTTIVGVILMGAVAVVDPAVRVAIGIMAVGCLIGWAAFYEAIESV